MKVRDSIIGLIGMVIMIVLYTPVFSFIERLTSRLSSFDNHVLTILFYIALFVGGYWYFKVFHPDHSDKDGNDNIKRDFRDYM